MAGRRKLGSASLKTGRLIWPCLAGERGPDGRGKWPYAQTIPGPVIGGISFLLYGMIGASGLRILVDSRVDYGRSRNLMLTSIVFVTGLSGISVNIGTVSLTGMVLACVVAMALSLIFYILDKLKLTNDRKA